MATEPTTDRALFRRPTTLTPLIGREQNVAAALALLHRPDVRLVVLTGPGGVGKTRLALHLADELRHHFADGVAFVSLARVRVPELILGTIAATLEIREGAERLDAHLPRVLRDKQLLLILDNFEQVAAAAPQLADLLAACPNLTALVTSRAALDIGGEHILPVPPLALPDPLAKPNPTDLGAYAAIRLFAARAEAVDPHFRLDDATAPVVGEICRRLDGLPLAIELAAARTRILPPAALLARLEPRLPLLSGQRRDQPARLQTMRNAIAWSYDLLAPPEQALFRRLAVFAGGFTLEAADTLAAAGHAWTPLSRYVESWGPVGQRWLQWWSAREAELGQKVPTGDQPPPLAPLSLDILDGLSSLVRQSLLRRVEGSGDEPRFEMLETIREFGLEQLEAAGEGEATPRAHAVQMLDFAEAAGLHLWGTEQRQWMDRIEAEHDNLRAALAWGIEHGDAASDVSLRIGESLWLFWQTRSHVSEGRGWLETAVARPGGQTWSRAAALNVAGALAWIQNDGARAQALLIEARAIWTSLQHNIGLGRSLFLLALVAWRRGNYPEMVALAQEALPLFQAWEDLVGAAVCLLTLGVVAHFARDDARATTLLDEALAQCHVAGFVWGAALTRYYAGEIARDRGEYARAARSYGESLDLSLQQGDKWVIAAVAGVATIADARRQFPRAARLFGASDAFLESLSAPLPTINPELHAESVARVRANLGEDRFAAAWAAGRALTPEGAIAEAAAVMQTASSPARAAAASTGGLTPREREVLRLVVAGQTDKEIAAALSLAPATISDHVRKILNKLEVANRAGAAAAAVRRGLV